MSCSFSRGKIYKLGKYYLRGRQLTSRLQPVCFAAESPFYDSEKKKKLLRLHAVCDSTLNTIANSRVSSLSIMIFFYQYELRSDKCCLFWESSAPVGKKKKHALTLNYSPRTNNDAVSRSLGKQGACVHTHLHRNSAGLAH